MRVTIKNMNEIFYLAHKNQTLIMKNQIHNITSLVFYELERKYML